ncbi:MAG: hypothetical protein R6V28_03035 [Nitriliruptoraceae bacterium]
MPRMLLLVFVTGLTLAACTGSDAETIADQAATIDDELGADWDAQVVEDDRDGSFVLANPTDAEVWTIGSPTATLAEVTAGTAWSDFWLPAIEAAAVDRSNVRAVVADTDSVPGTVVSWQVNVNADDPGLELDAEELAEDLRTRFTDQGLEVIEAGPTSWNERDIALVAFEVPAEVFGGEARYVRQWFIAEQDPAAMWSFSCDAPADPELTAELCRTGLDGFRVGDGATSDDNSAA